MTDLQRWMLAILGWILLVAGAGTSGATLWEYWVNPVEIFDCANPSALSAPSIELRGCLITGEPEVDMVLVFTQEVESSAYPLGVTPGGDAVALLFSTSRPAGSLDGRTVHLKGDQPRATGVPVFVEAELRYEEDYGDQVPLPFVVILTLIGGLIAWFVRPTLSDGGRFIFCMLGTWFGLGTSVSGVIRASVEGPVGLLQLAVGLPVLVYALWRGRQLYPLVSGRKKR